MHHEQQHVEHRGGVIGTADSGSVHRTVTGAKRIKVIGAADPGIVPAVPGRHVDASVHPSSTAPTRLAFYPARP